MVDGNQTRADVSASHAERRVTMPATATAVLDAMPCAGIVVEVGSGRVLFANRAAGAVSLEHLALGDARLGYYATDSGGARMAREETPIVRAGHGEEFDALRMGWHTPRGVMHYRVSSRAAESAGDGSPAVAVVTFVDETHLERAQGDLRRTARAREEFVAAVTHELKEPLSAMMLALQLVEGMAESGGGQLAAREVLPHLAVMRRQGLRLGQLVENLLDASRVSEDVIHLHPEAVDLCEVAREVVGRFRRDDPVAAETVSLVACEPVLGYFDRGRIEQALGNLLINATRYGAGKPVTVRVSAGDAGDAETAVIEVADRGIGIDAADRGRVFERFERAANGHRQGRLGLGLYVVRRIAEAHGGRVDVESELGRGSAFTLSLPRHRMHGRGGG